MELSQSFTTAGSCVDDVPASIREQRGGRRHPHLGQSHQGDFHLSQQAQQASSPAPQAKFKLEDVVRETLCLDEVPRKQCMDINIQVRNGSCKDDFSILRLTIFSHPHKALQAFQTALELATDEARERWSKILSISAFTLILALPSSFWSSP